MNFTNWESMLISLLIGIVIGALAMRLGNRKLRQQKNVHQQLEKNKAELENYRQELAAHFAHSAQLLDKMAEDYRQLYQHMAQTSHHLIPEADLQLNPFEYKSKEPSINLDDESLKQPPLDYSAGASGLLKGERAYRD